MMVPRILRQYRNELGHGLAATLKGNSHLRLAMRYHVGLCDRYGNDTEALGKMLRPSLLLFTVSQLGIDHMQGLPAAIGLELVHNFSLIHDDIQDRDEMRRGRPAVWRIWGVAQAINAGDLMYAAAVHEALRSGSPAAGAIVEAATAMIEGQGLDLDFEHRWVDTESYFNMIDKKTGALISCAFLAGGILAGADAEVVGLLTKVGHELGRAFQIRDDILGVWGDGKVTGKPQGSDIRRKKKALPAILAMQCGDDGQRRFLNHAYAQDEIKNGDVAQVVDLMSRLDVREMAEEMAQAHLEKAADHLDRLPFSEEGNEMMQELIAYLARREK
jgi:geranylgeranyl diphosphate synthase, type I